MSKIYIQRTNLKREFMTFVPKIIRQIRTKDFFMPTTCEGVDYTNFRYFID